MSDPEFWFPWLKLAAFTLGLLVGSFAVGSPSWVWLRRQILNGSAVTLALFGTILMSMSIWTSVQIEGPGFKALFEQIAALEAATELNNAMSNIRIAELEALNDLLPPDIDTPSGAAGGTVGGEMLVRIDPDTLDQVSVDPDIPFVGISALQFHNKEELTAFKEFLSEFPRDKAPVKWAEAQVYLGELLLATPVTGFSVSGKSRNLQPDALIVDENPDDKLARLREAREAFEAALEIFSKEGHPIEWAKATSGVALSVYLEAKLQEPASNEGIQEAIKLWNQSLRVLDEAGAETHKVAIQELLQAATQFLLRLEAKPPDAG